MLLNGLFSSWCLRSPPNIILRQGSTRLKLTKRLIAQHWDSWVAYFYYVLVRDMELRSERTSDGAILNVYSDLLTSSTVPAPKT